MFGILDFAEMGTEGFSSKKWSWPVRQEDSNRGNFKDSKRYQKGNLSTETDSRRKVHLLHDWWLVKADPDSHGKILGIGGFTLKENQGKRCFYSAAIVKKHDAVTLETVDGITLMLHGYLNRSRTLENGFSEKVCDHFLIGFPYYWEEFASLSGSEEPGCSSPSTGVSPETPAQETRGSNKMRENTAEATPTEAATPAQGTRGSNRMIGNTAEATPTEASNVKKGTRKQKQSMDSSSVAGGPLTRSRSRLLASKRCSKRLMQHANR